MAPSAATIYRPVTRKQRPTESSASPGAGDNPGNEAEGEEDDYLSDRFLIQSTSSAPRTTAAERTYTERRKQAQIESELRQEKSRTKSRKEREEEAREEGLRRSLFEISKGDGDSEVGVDAGRSKAMEMMFKMGFRPGQSLGVDKGKGKRVIEEVESDDGSLGRVEGQGAEDGGIRRGIGAGSSSSSFRGLGGIGSKSGSGEDSSTSSTPGLGPSGFVKSATPPTIIEKPKTEPLKIEIRQGRSGLGIPLPTTKKARVTTPLPIGTNLPATESESKKQEVYLSKAREEFEERKAEGILARARRTLISLDEQKGYEESIYHLDPFEIQKSQEEKRRRLLAGEMTARDRSDLGYLDDDFNPRAEGNRGFGFEVEVVDSDEDGDQGVGRGEREDWLRLDARTRLSRTLDHLRDRHLYCFWCGAVYDSKEQLEDECPGLLEDDH